jgi:hypothetical protein
MLVYVSGCVALLFFQHRRWMWVVKRIAPASLTRE